MNGGWQNDDWDWTPAKGAPGELFTPEGQIKATGAFWRNLTHRTHTTPEQRSMMRIGTYLIVGVVGFIALAIIISAVL
ncbi:MAG TPA: hypothetical protein PLV13_04305 [Ilumatobacteraceae bacterium]|nr:hypothetical protein [Ilumatobacteraceae bacterium]